MKLTKLEGKQLKISSKINTVLRFYLNPAEKGTKLIIQIKMPQINFFNYGTMDNSKNQPGIILFDFTEDLPFPLSMPYYLRIAFGIYLILLIIGGLICRRIILKFLRAPETKSNPINSLIWMDQICGIVFGTFNLIFGSVTLILPVSLGSIMGEQFCNSVPPLAGCINLTGYIIWSALIAIYRTLYIKAQNWVKYKIGEKRLLKLFIFLGSFVQLSLSLTIFYFDDDSLVVKVCHHYSPNDLEIMQQYRVS